MLTGWLIYTKQDALKNQSYIDWFINEANKQNIELTLIHRETIDIGIKNHHPIILLNEKIVSLPHFTVIRTIEPTLQYLFDSFGVHTFNNYHVAHICNNKIKTYLTINKLNIPTVDTYFYKSDSLPTEPPLSFPFVIKNAYGRSGKQVYYIESKDEWEQIKKGITFHELVIQKANVQLGKDVRVFIIGKEIVAAVLRHNEHDFRANFTLGGQAIPYELNKDEITMIQKIVNHFDFGLVGIDFLIDHNDNLLFNEIEDVVGSRILSETTRINLLQKYVTFIKNQVKKAPTDN